MYGGRNDEDGSFSKVECYEAHVPGGGRLPPAFHDRQHGTELALAMP